MKIGLYFGSFNPIHTGHLIIANLTQQSTDLQQVWLVVSPQNPLKKSNTLLNEYHRLHMVREAIEGNNHLKATDIEFHLPKPSYTIDTLTYLSEKYPQHSFAVIMGSDSFQNLPAWKNHLQLLEQYEIYVYERPGFTIPIYSEKQKVHVVKAPLLEISSTQIRNFIKQGISIRYMVHDKVADEIYNNRYYAG